MRALIEILLLTAAGGTAVFASNFAKGRELRKAVGMENEEEASKRVRSILNESGGDILDEVANDALFLSIVKERGNISEMLINYASNADPELKFSSEAVELTLVHEMESTLDLLLTKNVDYNRLDKYDGRSFVFAAIPQHRIRMLEKLMGKKDHFEEGLLDVRERTEFGETALHMAAESNEHGAALMEILLKAGAKTNVTNANGLTPMQYAISRGNVGCVKALIKYDAEPSLEFARGSYWKNKILPLLKGYDAAARRDVKGAIYLEIYEKITES